jgi:hypothetical protein
MHHRAKLNDEQVKLMRQIYQPWVKGYETMAKQFNCGISTARDILTYRTRRDVR